MIPSSPISDVTGPYACAINARRIDRRESVVQRDVEHERHQNSADEIEQAAGETKDGRWLVPLE